MCAQSTASALVTVTKSGPKNTPATPPVAKMRRASGEACAAASVGKSAVPAAHHRLAGQELQRRRVRGGFGLDEHARVLRSLAPDVRSRGSPVKSTWNAF